MTALLERIEKEVRELTTDEKEILLADLVSSLDTVKLSDTDQAWIEVAERRYDELISGKVKGIPAHDFFKEIRRELGWK
jgi:putative addiction module component (TIGR02574 family)